MIESIITPDQDSIIVEVEIAAPPERVFKAISDPQEVLRRAPELHAFEMDLRLGGRWHLEMRPPQPYHGVSGGISGRKSARPAR